MQEQLQEILELMKKHKEPGITVDVSTNLLRRYAPAEREESVRKMIEDALPKEIISEEREFIVQKYLSLTSVSEKPRLTQHPLVLNVRPKEGRI